MNIKPASNGDPKLEKGRNYYHCCLVKTTTGVACPAPRFDSSDIFKHLKRKMHRDPKNPPIEGLSKLPKEVVLCEGRKCTLCDAHGLVDLSEQADEPRSQSEDKEVKRRPVIKHRPHNKKAIEESDATGDK